MISIVKLRLIANLSHIFLFRSKCTLKGYLFVFNIPVSMCVDKYARFMQIYVYYYCRNSKQQKML